MAEVGAQADVNVVAHLRLPDVLQPFGRTPIQAVDAPDAALADGPWWPRRGRAWSRSAVSRPVARRSWRNGIRHRTEPVMSNARVVAGSDSVTVESGGQNYDDRGVL